LPHFILNDKIHALAIRQNPYLITFEKYKPLKGRVKVKGLIFHGPVSWKGETLVCHTQILKAYEITFPTAQLQIRRRNEELL
jgi:hypothetical protein